MKILESATPIKFLYFSYFPSFNEHKLFAFQLEYFFSFFIPLFAIQIAMVKGSGLLETIPVSFSAHDISSLVKRTIYIYIIWE